MGCEVAIDNYLFSIVKNQDLVLHEMERTIKAKPINSEKISRLGKIHHGFQIIMEDLVRNREELINRCKYKATNEDEECAILYSELRTYLSENESEIEDNALAISLDGVDAAEGMYANLKHMLTQSQVDKYIRECIAIQKSQK
jgi:hypothetical protein